MGASSPIRKRMDSILHDIISTALVPALKQRGYRKKGSTLIRNVNDVCHVVNVQKNKWNEGDRSFARPTGDLWWEFMLNSTPRRIAEISSEIERLMTLRVLPWLEQFQSDDKVLEFQRVPTAIE
jgi:hypothetical protein